MEAVQYNNWEGIQATQQLVLEPSNKAGTSQCEQEHSESPELKTYKLLKWKNLRCQQTIVVSKGAFIVLVWTFIVSIVLEGMEEGEKYGLLKLSRSIPELVRTGLGLFAALAVARLFFPLAGFLADVQFGRYKMIIVSLGVVWISSVFSFLATILYSSVKEPTVLYVFAVLAVPLLLVGLAGFYSNIVQFGTDQLQTASSEQLSLFIHWLVWVHYLGGSIAQILISTGCIPLETGAYVLQPLTLVFVTVVLVTSFFVRHWLYRERTVHNPYKMVYKVLKFAWRHKYPIHRSALTYWEDKLPSRIDFGKEKYGGPFTTEQVEDVKTLWRVTTILLSIGPTFTVAVASEQSLAIFGSHLMNGLTFNFGVNNTDNITVVKNCNPKIVLFDSGFLSTIIVILSLPLYIVFVRPVLNRSKLSGTLKRLGVAAVSYLISILCNLLIDAIGHGVTHPNAPCMFVALQSSPKLQINSAVLLLPNTFNAFGYILLNIAAFEFVCAQSPHAMKGLMIGIFFAVEGLFQLIGVIITLPFSFDLWNSLHPTNPSCGVGYYLTNVLIALAGMVIYCITAKKYKYRQRDEPSVDQQLVEAYYERTQNYSTIMS